MGKLTKGRLVLVAALAVSASGLASFSCGRAPRTGGGSIALTVTVPAKAQVNQLSYVVTGHGIAPIAGSLHTARPQDVYEALIANVPVGDDDTLVVSALSTDKQWACKRATKVSVHKNATTRVRLDLECGAAGDGKVVITVALACSGGVRLVSYSVAPLSASVGGTITLAATPLDADAGTLAYAWSAPSGSFDDPEAPVTSYLCSTPGHVTLNLIAASDLCQDSQDIEIDCLGPQGDDVKDAGVDAPSRR
jgi:hypothetical protein